MKKVDNVKTGKVYLFIKKDNNEFKGTFLDKDNNYIFIKNVKHGAKFTSLVCLPIDELVRVS